MALNSLQIIPYYSHPHVHTVVRDDSWYDEAVAPVPDPTDLPYSTAIAVGADTGIDNTWVRLSSREAKIAIFGKGNFEKYGQSSLQADELFNGGKTNVWLMRVLPDNATYANKIVMAHFRKGKILDDLSQETGKHRLEIKFSIAYATKPKLSNGALKDLDIEDFARSLATDSADPLTGYMSVPLYFVRSTGRGKYGNSLGTYITRDIDAEREYNMKMYRFNLIGNAGSTKIANVFAGSLTQSSRYDVSTLIGDVIDYYETGSVPISVVSFEESFNRIFEFYQEIVNENETYLIASNMTDADKKELAYAKLITEESFDPIFGIRLNSRVDEMIPYYRNYTTRESGSFVAPALTIPNQIGAKKPLNTSDWNSAFVGAKVLMLADPMNDGKRWMYTVTSIEAATGNIIYDEGTKSEIDEDQYDGVRLSDTSGFMLSGGHDGDFQEISVNGKTRAPMSAEMKILLSKEFVKAFRGIKDRKILSPTRVNLDFIFDANYNMTSVEDDPLQIDQTAMPIYNGSTVITDKDAQQLIVLGTGTVAVNFADLNVKQALYDLNEFRNRNGMTVNPERGAGCSLYLDTNLTGLDSYSVNNNLINVIRRFDSFVGHGCSIDLGYLTILDPVSRKKIQVTATYLLAQRLIPHIAKYGLNKPYTYKYSRIYAYRRTQSYVTSGQFMRGTFHPDIDLIDWDVKEMLYKSRINYYITTEEGRCIERASQNTRQMGGSGSIREMNLPASTLLEEHNVRVLNLLKKSLEKSNREYLYEVNDPTARKGYTTAQMQKFKPWIGSLVEDLEIYFEANEWEQEHMMFHCYAAVSFKDVAKRIILEIGISRPDYSGGVK